MSRWPAPGQGEVRLWQSARHVCAFYIAAVAAAASVDLFAAL